MTGILFGLYYFSELLGIVAAWVYVYLILIQTRLIAFILGLGGMSSIAIGYFTDSYAFETGVYVVSFLAISCLVAHLLAFGISFATGFRV